MTFKRLRLHLDHYFSVKLKLSVKSFFPGNCVAWRNILYVSLLLQFFLLISVPSFAQQLRENEIVVIKGEKYVLHQVRTGETIYSISKNYKISRETLEQNNPRIVENGLKIGEILKIPYDGNAVVNQDTKGDIIGDPSRFIMHTITSRKETPYFIAKRYNVTVEHIYAYNPGIRRFKKRMEIRIPVWEDVKEAQPVLTNQRSEQKKVVKNAEYKEAQKHLVSSGETLYSIARKYGISEEQLLEENPEAKDLQAGSILLIPDKWEAEQKSEVDDEPVLGISEKSPDEATSHFFEHIIESGETMWRLTRKYKVTEEELIRLNPALKNAFPAGLVIKVPVKKAEKAEHVKVDENVFMHHLVERGETKYGLAQKYNISIPEIEQYNPVLLTRNLIIGETLLIPKAISPEEESAERTETIKMEVFERIKNDFIYSNLSLEVPEECNARSDNSFGFRKYEIALFLPLFLEANDTLNREVLEMDSLITENEEVVQISTTDSVNHRELFKRFYGDTENYIQFYEGVLLAIDTMLNRGMNVKLSVYDTQNSVDTVKKHIYREEFLETDLIIGPVRPNLQRDIANIAGKNRIPMVSPIASSSNIVNSNPYYFQVVPDREYQAEKTAEMVAEEYFNSNFIVLKTRNYDGTIEGELVELIQEKLFNSGLFSTSNGLSYRLYDFEKEGPFGLRRILSHHKENVVFIPSSVEGELSVAISNLNNLSDEFSITLIGNGAFQQRFSSIEVEQFHNLKMKTVVPSWMDYKNPVVIDFVEKFINSFGTEPNNYGAQGYDAAFFFLNALEAYGKDFSDCLPYFHRELVRGNYHFEKVSPMGGYMNTGVSVISYDREYNVARSRVKGQPRLVMQK